MTVPLPPVPPTAAAPLGYPQTQPSNGMALASMIVGISSVVFCGVGGLMGPVAIVLGLVARRKPGGRAQSLTGIVTGIVGTLVGIGTVIAVVAVMLADADSGPPLVNNPETQDLLDDPAGAGYEQYAGGTQETPCYSFEGAEGWVANLPQADLDLCFMEYELWAEYELGSDGEPEVTSFGVGSIVAQVVVEPISDTSVEAMFPGQDVEAMRTYLLENYFVSDDFVVSEVEDALVGGLPATRFVQDSTISDTRVTYALWTPTVYAAGASGSSDFFLITIVSTHDSIVEGDSVDQRVMETFAWK